MVQKIKSTECSINMPRDILATALNIINKDTKNTVKNIIVMELSTILSDIKLMVRSTILKVAMVMVQDIRLMERNTNHRVTKATQWTIMAMDMAWNTLKDINNITQFTKTGIVIAMVRFINNPTPKSLRLDRARSLILTSKSISEMILDTLLTTLNCPIN